MLNIMSKSNVIKIRGLVFTITAFRALLTAFVIIGAGIIVTRLLTGFSIVTNLNDAWPWGLWIAFDVFTGVALAGGGYSTAFLVHILHCEKYQSLARCSLLVSLVGYFWVMTAEILDIGQWLNFWRPFVSWGHDSVLFEIFWCIMIYTSIQVLEFGEIFTERFGKCFHRYFKKALPFLLILGVLFPTFHQASLGGLFLLAKSRMYSLWWSEYLPIFFLMSSFFVGPATVCIVNWLTRKFFKNDVPVEVLTSIARVGGKVMLAYLVLKIGDLLMRGQLGLIFYGNLESDFFLVEMLLGLILPIMIVFSKYGETRNGLMLYGVFTCFGLIINRMNTVFTSMYGHLKSVYLPSVWEFAVTLAIISMIILVYCFLVDNFNVLNRNNKLKTEDVDVKEKVLEESRGNI